MQQLIDVQRESEVGKTSYGHVRENGGRMRCIEHNLAWTVSKQKFNAHARYFLVFSLTSFLAVYSLHTCARRCWLTMHRAAVNAHNIAMR